VVWGNAARVSRRLKRYIYWWVSCYVNNQFNLHLVGKMGENPMGIVVISWCGFWLRGPSRDSEFPGWVFFTFATLFPIFFEIYN
jgi:hypothetical protein